MLKKLSGIAVVVMAFIFMSGCSKDVPTVNDSNYKQDVKELDVYKKFPHPEIDASEKHHKLREGLSEWTPVSESRKVVMDKAKAFCAKTNTKMIVMEEHVANLPFLINHYPSVEITFVCHDLKKKKKKIVKLSSDIQNDPGIKKRYRNLMILKKLFDNGTITKKEFESEKKKLLQEN